MFEEKKTSQTEFWNWFKQNEEMLFDFEKDQKRVFDLLVTQLHKVNPHLTFEFGPKQNGQREFVLSAGGIHSAFPAVISLAAAAPKLSRWKIIKFRPRRPPLGLIQIGHASVDPDDVRCSLQSKDGKINIVLFFGDVDLDKTLRNHLGFVLLDSTLGEYDVETFVGHIDFLQKKADSKLEKIAFRNLPKTFDALIKSMTN